MATIKFSEAKDVVQGEGNYLRESGIFTGCKLMEIGYSNGSNWEAIDINIETPDEKLFRARYFAKAMREDDVDPSKTDDKWIKGVKQGKLSPKEQVAKNFDHLQSLVIMTAKALGDTFEQVAYKMGDCQDFKEVADKFVKNYNPVPGKEKLVNFGCYWKNNDDKQTSNLALLNFGANKVAISQFIEGEKSGIVLSDYESKNQYRKYEYNKEGENTQSPEGTLTTQDGETKSSGSIFGD